MSISKHLPMFTITVFASFQLINNHLAAASDRIPTVKDIKATASTSTSASTSASTSTSTSTSTSGTSIIFSRYSSSALSNTPSSTSSSTSSSSSFESNPPIAGINDIIITHQAYKHPQYHTILKELPNHQLAIGWEDGTLDILNTKDGKLVHSISKEQSEFGASHGNVSFCESFYGFDLLPNGLLISLSTWDIFRIYDLTTGKMVAKMKCPHLNTERYSSPTRFVVLPNGNLAIGDCEGFLSIWSIDNKYHMERLFLSNMHPLLYSPTLKGHTYWMVNSLAVLPNNTLMGTVIDHDDNRYAKSEIKLWDLEPGSLGKELQTIEGRDGDGWKVIKLLSNNRLVVKSETGAMTIFSHDSTKGLGRVIQTIRKTDAKVRESSSCQECFSEIANGVIVTCSKDGTLKFWSTVPESPNSSLPTVKKSSDDSDSQMDSQEFFCINDGSYRCPVDIITLKDGRLAIAFGGGIVKIIR